MRRSRRYKRYRKHRRSTRGWGGPGQGFPKNRIVKFRYTTYRTFGIQQLNEYFYSANSCYDPEQSVLGFQPYGWDQWGVFYKRYTVLKSKITVQWGTVEQSVNANGYNQSVPVIIGTGLRGGGSSIIPSAYQMCQLPSTSYTVMQLSKEANSRPIKTTATYRASNFWNVKDPQDVEDIGGQTGNYGGGGSDPARQAYFQVFTGPITNIANYVPSTTGILVTIDYTCMLQDPWELTLS